MRRRTATGWRRSPGLLALVVLGVLAAAPRPGAAAPTDVLDLVVAREGATPAPLRAVLAGKPALVSLLASYCAPCRLEVPVLRHAVRRFGAEGLRVVAVAIDVHDAPGLRRLAPDWGIDFDAYWVPADQDDAVRRLLPDGLPTTFVVARDGVTRHDRLLRDADVAALVPGALGTPGSR